MAFKTLVRAVLLYRTDRTSLKYDAVEDIQ